jgi:peptide/nickel transport system ATP-binding protein
MSGSAQPLLLVQALRKHFPLAGGWWQRSRPSVKAVDTVSFAVRAGETLGVVGESGCGKSTLARLLMRLIEPDAGSVVFDGEAVDAPHGISVRELRRAVQMVFQDSYASLNPRLPIATSLMFGPRANGASRAAASARSRALLARVGLEPDVFGHRYPHALSGGQRQRVNIARALALQPRLVILDEAVSALDKSVEAQVLNLLVELRAELGLTFVFISHDLGVVRYISDRVMVMYLGRIVEIGPVELVFARPRHPYTAALMAAAPSHDPARRTLEPPLAGDPPNPIDLPGGCRFRTRCAFAEPVCTAVEPGLAAAPGAPGHDVACHRAVAGSGHSGAPA